MNNQRHIRINHQGNLFIFTFFAIVYFVQSMSINFAEKNKEKEIWQRIFSIDNKLVLINSFKQRLVQSIS